MLKTQFLDKSIPYTGPELRPHFILSQFRIQGSAVVAFRGPCDVKTEALVDWEDRLAADSIRAAEMVHFLGEFFGPTLPAFGRCVATLEELAALGKVIVAAAGSWPAVMAGRVTDRLGKGTRAAARDAWLADAVQPQFLGRVFGFHRMGDSIGAIGEAANDQEKLNRVLGDIIQGRPTRP